MSLHDGVTGASCIASPGNIPDESKVATKRGVSSYRAPHTRAKFQSQPAVIQLSTFGTTQADAKDLTNSATVSHVSTKFCVVSLMSLY